MHCFENMPGDEKEGAVGGKKQTKSGARGPCAPVLYPVGFENLHPSAVTLTYLDSGDARQGGEDRRDQLIDGSRNGQLIPATEESAYNSSTRKNP